MSKRLTLSAAYDALQATTELKTAKKWQKLAIEHYEKFGKTKERNELLLAEHYRDEALEHAAMVGDEGATVRIVQRAIDKHRNAVWSEP